MSAPKAAITQGLLDSLNEGQRKQLMAMIHLAEVQDRKKAEAEAAAAAAAKAAAFAAAAAASAAAVEEDQAREEIPEALEIPLPNLGFKADGFTSRQSVQPPRAKFPRRTVTGHLGDKTDVYRVKMQSSKNFLRRRKEALAPVTVMKVVMSVMLMMVL